MAEVILFEDDGYYIDRAMEELASGGHTLVAHRASIVGAFEVLGHLAAGNLASDFIIVDGTLSDWRGEQPTFAYTHPDEKEPKVIRQGLLRRKREVQVPKVTVVEVDTKRGQMHGRAIVEIVHRLHIPAQTIGFSGEPMLDIPVDLDVPHKQSRKINEAIAELS